VSFHGIRQHLFAFVCGCTLVSAVGGASAFAQEQNSENRSFEEEAQYVSFQVPGYYDTYPQSINRSFSVAGYCSQGTTNYHGFVRDARGTVTLIDPPGSTFTIARSINSAGTIAGYFQSSSGVQGFVRFPRGSFVTFDYLGNETVAWSINDLGAVTGYYVDGVVQHGFLRSSAGKLISA